MKNFLLIVRAFLEYFKRYYCFNFIVILNLANRLNSDLKELSNREKNIFKRILFHQLDLMSGMVFIDKLLRSFISLSGSYLQTKN